MTLKWTRRRLLQASLIAGTGSLLVACVPPTPSPSTAEVTPSLEAQTAIPSAVATEATTSAAPEVTPVETPAEGRPIATIAPDAARTPRASTYTPGTAAAQLYPAAASVPDAPNLAGRILAATQEFLDGLGDLRGRATFDFDDAERVRWHWTTPAGFRRNGLPLKDMSVEQQQLAFGLLRASLSELGYLKSRDIMALQQELRNDPLDYYVSVFGTPGGQTPWSWRWEGHHLSRHFTVNGETVTMVPFFHGSWPTISSTGFRAMPREEDAAREIVLGLDEAQRGQVIFQARALGQHLTGNKPRVEPLEAVGLPVGELGPDQQPKIAEIIQAYLAVLPDEIRAPIDARVQSGLADTRFGWAGSLEPLQPQYWRLQGPSFVLEFDNSRNGGTHIHSVWRDFENDFGGVIP